MRWDWLQDVIRLTLQRTMLDAEFAMFNALSCIPLFLFFSSLFSSFLFSFSPLFFFSVFFSFSFFSLFLFSFLSFFFSFFFLFFFFFYINEGLQVLKRILQKICDLIQVSKKVKQNWKTDCHCFGLWNVFSCQSITQKS